MRSPTGVSVTSAAKAAPTVMSLIATLKHVRQNYSYAPPGLDHFPLAPTACAVGCILSPLRGWRRFGSPLSRALANYGTNSAKTRRKTILVAIALVCALPLLAEKASGPKYDLSTETKMKGTIEEVKLPNSGKEIAHLLVKVGADTVDVYLCPKAFLDDMGVSFSKGEELSLTGSKVKQGEAEMLLAREIVKGTDTVVLRDEKGNPVW